MVGILDYGVGNITSLKRALERIGCGVVIGCSELELTAAKVLFLPGVGSFSFAMNNLRSSKMDEFIENRFKSKDLPIVGICLGMQLMFENSEEGLCTGLGLLQGRVVKFNDDECHVGWNKIRVKRQDLFIDQSAFYFNHSYRVECPEYLVSGESFYQGKLISVVELDAFTGVQFHPEKSQNVGENLLKLLVGVS